MPEGALIALPPLTFPLPPPALAVQIRGVLRQGLPTALRWGKVYRILEAVHPSEVHWYLAVLGVDPSAQGKGCGRALLGRWLEEVDLECHPVYLETDRRENLGFYAAFGFDLLDELDVLGVPVWRMWRKEKPAPTLARGGSAMRFCSRS